MAFSDFKSIFDVAQKYGTRLLQDKLFKNAPVLTISEALEEDLAYAFAIKKPSPSEIALSENFISPMIRFVAKRHSHIMFWSREYYLEADQNLCGTPDYLFSYTPQRNELVLGTPLVCVSEAKVERFGEAWGQTLAEMLAIQKLGFDFPIYGWTTNGDIWQFGKLEGNIFMQHIESFSIATSPEKIAGILDWIFTEAVRHAEVFLARKKAESE